MRTGPARVLSLVLLWALALHHFSAPRNRHGEEFRVDRPPAVAYPMSDAAMDFQNGLALASGDGWVNWRSTNRWSVYRPGWGAFLAGLGALTGHDPARMQAILSLLLAAVAPLFFLLVVSLYPGRRSAVIAFVATLFFVLYPSGTSWWFQSTMMSEGPAMLLSLVFCILAVRLGGRERWSWGAGLTLGLVAAALALVRAQSRYGVLATVLLLALMSARQWRSRLPFFALFACGFLALAGPLYLKTSWHLERVDLGTPYFSLWAALEYTEVGQQAGGPGLPADREIEEGEAMDFLAGRVRAAIGRSLASWPRMLLDGLRHWFRYDFLALAKLFRMDVAGRQFVAIALLLTALGLACSWGRRRAAALVPLVYSFGYLLPLMPFWFYRDRYGVPVSWVGMAYAWGAVLLFLERAGGGRRFGGETEELEKAALEPEPSAGWPRSRLFALLGGWTVIATAVLLYLDLAPLPTPDVDRLLADPRSRAALAAADIPPDSEVREELAVALDARSPPAVGIAFLPFLIEPDDRPLRHAWARLRPGEEPYTAFFFASPWKRGGSFELWQVVVPGRLYDGFRNGDEVVLVRPRRGAGRLVRSPLPLASAATAIPTRWSR